MSTLEALQQSIQRVRSTYGLLKPVLPLPNVEPPKRAKSTVVKSRPKSRAKRRPKSSDPNLPQERRMYSCVSCHREVALRSHGAVICQNCGSHVVSKHRLKRKVELRAI